VQQDPTARDVGPECVEVLERDHEVAAEPISKNRSWWFRVVGGEVTEAPRLSRVDLHGFASPR
jgi:hypothetical protein